MEDYYENRPCPKCGNYYVWTKYVSVTEYPDTDISYLERTCERCGYKWREKPLDDGKEQP